MDTNAPVYHALMKRRSEIAGEINHFEGQITQRKAELVHLDATLAIFGYDVPNLKFRAKTVGTAGLFHRGEAQRLIVIALRNSENGLTVPEIAMQIAAQKGWEASDKRFMVALTDKIGKQASKMKDRYRLKCERVNDAWVWSVEF